MMQNNYLSVSQLNGYVKNYIERDFFLSDIYVKGEVSNFKAHPSGTLYFSIKDEKSKINVVMFAFYASKNNFELKNGSMVLIHGKINVFEAAGSYQISAYEIIYDSIGQLYIQYEKLKKQLELEGLFSAERKKSLPKYPEKIGIITAASGAAIHDMVRTINNRYPIVSVYLFPCLVQGGSAAKDISEKIKLADSYNLDVLICGRGGGSIEDLWPFNEEIVARSIFECKTPIISAVGHQSDFTIADFVADVRALTPTDAAIKATPNINDLYEKIINYQRQLENSIKNIIKNNQNDLTIYKEKSIFKDPNKIYSSFRFNLDRLETKLSKSILIYKHKTDLVLKTNKIKLLKNINQYFSNKENDIKHYKVVLDALSPLKVMDRGYNIIKSNNKIVKSIDDININENVQVIMKDGMAQAKIIKKENKSWKN